MNMKKQKKIMFLKIFWTSGVQWRLDLDLWKISLAGYWLELQGLGLVFPLKNTDSNVRFKFDLFGCGLE